MDATYYRTRKCLDGVRQLDNLHAYYLTITIIGEGWDNCQVMHMRGGDSQGPV